MNSALRALLMVALGFGCVGLGPLAAQEQTGDGVQLQSETGRGIFASPGGDSIGHLTDNATPEFIEEEAEWVRIRVEGWVRRDSLDAPISSLDRNLSLSALRSDPDRYRGELVRWRVQYVGMQRADALRSDLEPGQPYLLVRDPGGEPGFVYAVVPPDLLPDTERLAPLQRIGIVGRVLAGRSPLTGHPIVELVEISHSP